MPWKRRRNQLYYYRSVYRDGHVCTEYVGRGPVGKLAAEIDEQQQAQMLEYREIRRRWNAVKSLISQYGKRSNTLLRTFFQAGGFYYSHGRWRQRMEADNGITSDMSREVFEAVVAAANSGSADALKEMREILRRNPGIWEAVGDLGEHAENALIGAIAGGNALLKESLKNTCASMMGELAGPTQA